MKKYRGDDDEGLLPELEELGRQLFNERAAWLTSDFDREMAARWERKTKRKIKEFGTLRSGRNRFMNLVDWVKANWEKSKQTRNVEIRGEECRVWIEQVGEIRGQKLTPTDHLNAVIDALTELASR